MKKFITILMTLVLLAGCSREKKPEEIPADQLWPQLINQEYEIWANGEKEIRFSDGLLYSEQENGQRTAYGKAENVKKTEEDTYVILFDDLEHEGTKFERTVKISEKLEVNGTVYQLKEIPQDPVYGDPQLAAIFSRLAQVQDFTDETGEFFQFVDTGEHYIIRNGYWLSWPQGVYEWQVVDFQIEGDVVAFAAVNSENENGLLRLDYSNGDMITVYMDEPFVYAPYCYSNLSQQDFMTTVEGIWVSERSEGSYRFQDGKLFVTDGFASDRSAYITGFAIEGNTYRLTYDLDGLESSDVFFINVSPLTGIVGLTVDGYFYSPYEESDQQQGDIWDLWNRLMEADSYTDDKDNYLWFDVAQQYQVLKKGNWNQEEFTTWTLENYYDSDEVIRLVFTDEKGDHRNLTLTDWEGDTVTVSEDDGPEKNYGKDFLSRLTSRDFYHTVAGFWHSEKTGTTYEFTEQGQLLISNSSGNDRTAEITDFIARHYHYFISYKLDGEEKKIDIYLLPANSDFTETIDIDGETCHRLFV